MNPRELVDYIRNGPTELALDEPLPRFPRRRTRSNPYDFNDFLQALQASETIRTIRCKSHQLLGITEDEWILLVEVLGSISDIQTLHVYCQPGSRDFRPFQAVAVAVNNAHSLRYLAVLPLGESLPRDALGLIALANALREHTTLQEFTLNDICSRLEAAHINALDPVLQSLHACPHLRKVCILTKCASADVMKNLLHLQSATELCLVLKTDQWLAVTDEIGHGRCNIQTLTLAMMQVTRSEATTSVQALAGAIQLDRNLEHLLLGMENGYTDEAGVALAEALTVNKTLRSIDVSDTVHPDRVVRNKATFGATAFEAFSAMLRVNTSLVLTYPPVESAGADQRLIHHHKQVVLEQKLNKMGRGRLLSSTQTKTEEWVDALHELDSNFLNDSPAFKLSCLYSLLRLQPAVCML
jgi:hypothetical protein